MNVPHLTKDLPIINILTYTLSEMEREILHLGFGSAPPQDFDNCDLVKNLLFFARKCNPKYLHDGKKQEGQDLLKNWMDSTHRTITCLKF